MHSAVCAHAWVRRCELCAKAARCEVMAVSHGTENQVVGSVVPVVPDALHAHITRAIVSAFSSRQQCDRYDDQTNISIPASSGVEKHLVGAQSATFNTYASNGTLPFELNRSEQKNASKSVRKYKFTFLRGLPLLHGDGTAFLMELAPRVLVNEVCHTACLSEQRGCCGTNKTEQGQFICKVSRPAQVAR